MVGISISMTLSIRTRCVRLKHFDREFVAHLKSLNEGETTLHVWQAFIDNRFRGHHHSNGTTPILSDICETGSTCTMRKYSEIAFLRVAHSEIGWFEEEFMRVTEPLKIVTEIRVSTPENEQQRVSKIGHLTRLTVKPSSIEIHERCSVEVETTRSSHATLRRIQPHPNQRHRLVAPSGMPDPHRPFQAYRFVSKREGS